MNTKNIIFLVAAIIVAAGLTGLILVERGNINLPTKEEPLPELTFTSYGGEQVSLSQFRGKPIIVNAWASWCPFCVQELPDFISLQGEFKDKIIVVAVNRAEAPATAKGYTDGRGLTEKLNFVLDPADSFYKSIGGFSMPETVFADKDGKIIFHKRGPMNLEEMKRRAEDLISK